jgi:hypothetical protein
MMLALYRPASPLPAMALFLRIACVWLSKLDARDSPTSSDLSSSPSQALQAWVAARGFTRTTMDRQRWPAPAVLGQAVLAE